MSIIFVPLYYLYLRSINLVVFLVCPDKSNIHGPVLVLDGYDDTVLVALDVEDHAIIGNETCIAIDRFDVGWRFPGGLFDIVIPGPQRLFGVGVLFPEFT